MLRLDDVHIAQGAFSLRADWQLEAGARVAILGPSGAGKSTLLHGIAGFTPLSAGQITWRGDIISALPPAARPVSILFQDQNLFPHLTLEQNLGLGLTGGRRLSAADRAQIAQALAQMGLAGLGARRPAEVSGGQQARAALARVLLQARPILLLDEPFAALGPALKAEMLEVVQEVAQLTQAVTLLVTHQPKDAQRFAEQVVFVAEGVAEAPTATAALFAKPTPALRAYLE